MANNTKEWTRLLKPVFAPVARLFCFPHSGGGPATFRNWPDHLPGNMELRCVEYPGHGSRALEEPYVDLGSLVAAIEAALEPYTAMPFAFFGHSLGALICFELARSLRKRGIAPISLFVSGRPAPQLPDTRPKLYKLPDDLFLKEIRALNGMPAAVLDSHELMELVLPVLRVDFTIVDTYEYTPDSPLDCPIFAYGGINDPIASREQMEGWRDQTTALFSLTMLPGDHFYIENSRPLLLRALSQELYKLLG